MLWLLPLDAGPVQVEMEPGLHVVPQWYDAQEWSVLVEILRRVMKPAFVHVLVGPVEAVVSKAWRSAPPRASTLVVVRGPARSDQRAEAQQWAHRRQHQVLVESSDDDDELAFGWLEHHIKPAVLEILERNIWRKEHPLAAFGLDNFDFEQLAGATEDPVELLWLFEQTIQHRIKYAAQGVGRSDYERSFAQAVGHRCVQKVRRSGGSTDSVRAMLDGSTSGTPPSALDSATELLAQAGLGVARNGEFHPSPLLHMARENMAARELIARALGAGSAGIAGLVVIASRYSTSSIERSPTLKWELDPLLIHTSGELQQVLADVANPPPILEEALKVLTNWEKAPWDPVAFATLRECRWRLRTLVDAPNIAHRTIANLEFELFTIILTDSHEDLPVAQAALGELQRLLRGSSTNWKSTLEVQAMTACASRHQALAQDREDLDSAKRLYETAAALALSTGLDLASARIPLSLAELASIQGDFDEAEATLRTEYERVEPWRRALIAPRIADCIADKGDLATAKEFLISERQSLTERQRTDPAPAFGRSFALVQDKLADILHRMGAFAASLDARRRTLIYGEVDEPIIIEAKSAETLAAQGALDEALQHLMRRVLPVFENRNHLRNQATTLERITSVHRLCGNLEQALQILRQQVLPAFERLGDVRAQAAIRDRIAQIFADQGDLDESVRIRQQDVLPIYERIGDAHSAALVRASIEHYSSTMSHT